MFASAPYLDLLGPLSSASGVNTAHADLSAFFLVSAAFALIAVLLPSAVCALVVPAALFGMVFAGRGIGVVLGYELTLQVMQLMMSQAISLVLMLGAMRQRTKPMPNC